MILIDMMNMVFIEYYMTKRVLKERGKEEFTKEDIPFYYHNFFTFFNRIIKEYGEVVVCWEGEDSLKWRRDIFPDYKRNRDGKKGEEDYKTLMGCIPEIRECLNNYPVKQLSVKGAEADDLIFTLAMHYDGDHTIISTDKDLTQILKFKPEISIYNPIKKTFAKPHKYLVEEKAIVGDKSDNIGGLYRVGEKKFEKMMEDKVFFNSIMNKGNNKEIFKQLLKIIDLRNIPNELKSRIVEANENTNYNTLQRENVEEFYFRYKLKELLMKW